VGNTDNGVAEAEADLDAKVCTDSDRASHRGCKMDMQQAKEEEEEAENTDKVDTALQGREEQQMEEVLAPMPVSQVPWSLERLQMLLLLHEAG